MEWIKRNIMFVAGSAVAVVLMGLAAYYLMSGMRRNDLALTKLNEEYSLLARLNNQKPHPGSASTVDNVAAAKKQRAQIMAFIRKTADQTSGVFRPVDPIPPSKNLDNAMFASALRKTIDQLQADAERNGVQLPTNFYFSFTAVRDRIQFDRAALRPLAEQLGDVKAVCDILTEARVNALDSVRRSRVSVHDIEAQQTTDYLTETATTNEIALLVPYEVSFRCFSPELAAVLAGYASSPQGLIVRAMNVEPATAGAQYPGIPGMDSPYGFMPNIDMPFTPSITPVTPPSTPLVTPTPQPFNPQASYRQYKVNPYAEGNPYANTDMGPYGAAGNPYGGNPYAPADPDYGAAGAGVPVSPYGYPATMRPNPRTRVAGLGRGGLPTLLDEKQFKVTMLVQVVKMQMEKLASNK